MKHTHLKDARGRAKLTQVQLAELSGVERSRISRLESEDSNPTLDTFDKLDVALRKLGALKRGERLTFGAHEAVA